MGTADGPNTVLERVIYSILVILIGGYVILYVAHALFGTPPPGQIIDIVQFYI